MFPLYGAELDKDRHFDLQNQEQLLRPNRFQPEKYGWEWFGHNHRDTIKPFTEGAWMTKHQGNYFLQYGAPGTEYNVYANGTYVGDDPLGPFTYAPYNPISYKPGGYMNGAGHGNTFQDNYGNYWNTGTPWIAVNWQMERRIAMFPTGFDQDNQLFANTRFGDFPHRLPTKKWEDKDELFTGWMLLAYQKRGVASSVRDTFNTVKLTGENPRTFWVAGQNRTGETLVLDLEKPCKVNAYQINYVDYKSNIYDNDPAKVYTQFKMYHSLDGKTWELLTDLTQQPKQDRPCAYVELDKPVKTRYLK